MQLDLWLFKNKITKKDFSKKIGIDRSHLYRIMEGKVSPSLRLAKKIQEATDNAVSAKEILFPE